MLIEKNRLFFLFVSVIFLSACNDIRQSNQKIEETKLVPIVTGYAISDFYKNDSMLLQKTDSIYNILTDKERAAQLIMPATGVSKKYGLPFSKILKLYRGNLIGGVLFLKGTKTLFEKEVVELKELSQAENKLPLVYSCDCEPTLFHRKFTDEDSMTVASALLTIDDVKKSAITISGKMKEMGFSWNFAPVADVKSEKSIINERSFSSDRKLVVSKSVAFIQALESEGIAATIKHFPGHGNIIGDTHKELVYIDSTLSEVNNFGEIIRQFPPVSVMIGHIAIKNNNLYNTNDLPSSLSHKIITSLLKDSLKFRGIVFTDAMSMGAVKNIPNADYLAIMAGNDVVLMPQNVRLLHSRILTLMTHNKLKRLQIETSVKKILRLKICLGIIK